MSNNPLPADGLSASDQSIEGETMTYTQAEKDRDKLIRRALEDARNWLEKHPGNQMSAADVSEAFHVACEDLGLPSSDSESFDSYSEILTHCLDTFRNYRVKQ